MGLYSGFNDLYLPPNYYYKLRDMRPGNQLVYFPQWEGAGAVSFDQYNAWNGAYVGVTLRQTGIGDGETCPLFDGANDYNNIFTAGLQGAFNGAEGTCLAWARVFNAGVWTDGAHRHIVTLAVNTANNQLHLRKDDNNNRLTALYEAGNIIVSRNITTNTLDWFHFAMTWSKSAGATGEVRVYFNGVQEGAMLTGLGIWAGNLAADLTNVGCRDNAPLDRPWYGYIAHAAVLDTPLTPDEIAWLATTSNWRIP